MLLVKGMILPNKRVVDLEINENTAYILKGPNGSGKSLLLRGLAGLYPVTYDVFQYENRTFSQWPIESFRSEVLYVAGQTSTLGIQSIEEYFQMPFKLKVYKDHQQNFDPLPYLEKWNIQKQDIGQLSSGQKQMISLLRALTLKAKILLLDEPMSNLDSGVVLELEDLLMKWKNKTNGSFIMVSHNEQQIHRLGKEIISF